MDIVYIVLLYAIQKATSSLIIIINNNYDNYNNYNDDDDDNNNNNIITSSSLPYGFKTIRLGLYGNSADLADLTKLLALY